MSALKQQIIGHIIDLEGGYINDPADSGGATKYGITEATARAYGYLGPMADLPRQVAIDIYATPYWDAVHADDLAKLSEAVTLEVVDTSVNMGPATAVKFLQRALNVMNQRGKLYEDLTVDGVMGGRTLGALGEYLSICDEVVLCRALNCLQGARYIELAESREKDERFVYGWIKNRVTL